jgi:nitrite reductase (NADH) small subunit
VIPTALPSGETEFSSIETITMTNWMPIANLEEIPRLGARQIKTDILDIALFRTGDDQVFAIQDHCPHRGGPLSQGIVHGASVTCPLHNWKIDLSSGEVLGPDQGCVKTYRVKVEEGTIYLAALHAESAA